MEEQDKIFYDMIKVYLAQMDSAVKISSIVCEHSDREEKELNGDDIICGLVYRLMVPMSQEEIQQSMTTADNILEVSECRGRIPFCEWITWSNIRRKWT